MQLFENGTFQYALCYFSLFHNLCSLIISEYSVRPTVLSVPEQLSAVSDPVSVPAVQNPPAAVSYLLLYLLPAAALHFSTVPLLPGSLPHSGLQSLLHRRNSFRIGR